MGGAKAGDGRCQFKLAGGRVIHLAALDQWEALPEDDLSFTHNRVP